MTFQTEIPLFDKGEIEHIPIMRNNTEYVDATTFVLCFARERPKRRLFSGERVITQGIRRNVFTRNEDPKNVLKMSNIPQSIMRILL